MKNGLVIHTDGSTADLDIFREVFVQKYHKNPLINYDRIGTMLDLGAHKGFVSIFVSALNADVKIISVEPDEKNFAFLLKNIEVNNLKGRVFPINKAMWSEEVKLNLYLSEKSPASHSVLEESIDSADRQSTEINTTTIYDLLATENIKVVDYLKIDIEGAEYEVLFSLDKDVLKKMKYIHIECHPTKEYKEGDMLTFLVNNGFRCYPVYKGEKVYICINEHAR